MGALQIRSLCCGGNETNNKQCFNIHFTTLQPQQKAKVAEPQTRGDIETEDAPRYKVLLLGDEEYEEEHVIERLVDVVDDVDKKQSIEIFYSAQKGGKGLVGVYPLEVSEFYVEQLARSEPMIFSELEKE